MNFGFCVINMHHHYSRENTLKITIVDWIGLMLTLTDPAAGLSSDSHAPRHAPELTIQLLFVVSCGMMEHSAGISPSAEQWRAAREQLMRLSSYFCLHSVCFLNSMG